MNTFAFAFSPTILDDSPIAPTIRGPRKFRPRSACQGHAPKEMVRASAISPDGTLMAVAVWGRPVRLLGGDGAEIRVFSGHSSQTLMLTFAPDGRRLASAGADGVVRIWSPNREVETRTMTGHEGGVFALVYSADGRQLASGGADGVIRLWESETGRLIGKFAGHNVPIISVAFHSDGKTLISGGLDSTLRRWKIEAGQGI